MKRWLVLSLALFSPGCPKKPPTVPVPGTLSAAPAPLPAGNATLNVSVRFRASTLPVRAEIDVSSDAGCAGKHAPLLDETLIVGADRALRNVFVWLESPALKAATYPPPSAPVVVDQDGCAYRPHAFTMMAGQPLEFRNLDGVAHNVHPTPNRNQGWNFSQGPGKTDRLTGTTKMKTFTTPEERPFRIKCDVHGWMVSWAAVHRHPFHGVTDENGRLTISAIPAGEYTVRFWHEKADRSSAAWSAERQITIGDGAAETVELDLGE